MTDTNSPAPTDAEILDAAEDFCSQYTHGGTTFDEFDEIGFARAVLAKWGQPAQAVVGGKPVYQASYKGGFWQDSSRERHEYLKTPEGSWATDWELRVLYAAPQPVAREPLTRQQLREAFYSETACTLGGDADFAEKVCRVVEKAHGIKGGQHVE